jgi:biotin carboxyl carrier protein
MLGKGCLARISWSDGKGPPMPIVMPQLNDAGDPGVVNEIFVNVGDQVAVADPVMAVEMEKAIIEIEATEAGTVKGIPVQLGDEVQVGQVLVELE